MINNNSTTRTLTLLLVAVAAVAVLGTGSVAANEPIPGYNATSDVRQPVTQDYSNAGIVQVELQSDATITDSDVAIIGEDGTTYSDVEPNSGLVVGEIPQSTVENQSDGELTVDINIQGSTVQTVNLTVKSTNAVVSEPVNASTLQNENVSITIDKSELSNADSLTYDTGSDSYRIDVWHGERFVAGHEFNTTNVNETFTVSKTGLTVNEFGQASGESRLYASPAVDEISVNGTVVYAEGAVGTDGGNSGAGGGVMIAGGLLALALVIIMFREE